MLLHRFGTVFDDNYYYTISSAQKLFTWMGHDVNGLSFVKSNRGLDNWESLGIGLEEVWWFLVGKGGKMDLNDVRFRLSGRLGCKGKVRRNDRRADGTLKQGRLSIT